MEKLQHGGLLSLALADPAGAFTDLGAGVAAPTFLGAEAVVPVLERAAALGFDGVELIGANGLLAPDLLDVLEAAAGLGLEVRLETDGRGLDAERLERILAVVTPWSFAVGLDARDPEPHDRVRGAGAWRRAIGAVRLLVEARQPVYLRTVVRADTFGSDAEVDAFVDWAADDLEVRGVWFGRPVEPVAAAASRWAPSAGRLTSFRALLEARPGWRGFVTHAWHRRLSEGVPAGETLEVCDRLDACDVTASADGVHPCPVLRDVALAPLAAAPAYLASPIRGQRLQWLRAAAIAEEDGPLLSCAECAVAFRRFRDRVRTWAVAPPLQEEAPVEERAVAVPSPTGLTLIVTERCDAGCDHMGETAGPAGDHLPVDVADRLLRQAQFAGVREVTFAGTHALQHPELDALLAAAGRYGLQVDLVGWGHDVVGVEETLIRFRLAIGRLWFTLRGGSAATHDAAVGLSGSFDVTRAALAWAPAARVPFGVRFVPAAGGLDEGVALLETLAAEGVEEVVVERELLGGDRAALRARGDEPAELRHHEALRARPDLPGRFQRFESTYLAAERSDGVCQELFNRPAAADARGRLHPCSRSAAGLLGPPPEAWPEAGGDLMAGLAAVAPLQARLHQLRERGFAGSPVGGRFGRCEYCAELLADPACLTAAGAPEPPTPGLPRPARPAPSTAAEDVPLTRVDPA